MKKRLNLLTALLLAVVMTLCLIPGAAAAEPAEGTLLSVVDPVTFKGDITLLLEYNKKPVSGIEVTLYKVGTGTVENKNVEFSLVDSLASAAGENGLHGLSAAQVEKLSADLAKMIRGMSKEKKAELTIAAKDSDKNGKVVYEDLDLGVYLLVKTERASDYDFDPILLLLPYGTEFGWEAYLEVNAKMSYDGGGGGETPDPPTPPDDPTPPGTDIPDDPTPGGGMNPPDDPTDDIGEEDPPLAVLPQTGLLQWPIPVMAAVGLLLVMLGILSERKRKARN